jgi:hypothetical protein
VPCTRAGTLLNTSSTENSAALLQVLLSPNNQQRNRLKKKPIEKVAVVPVVRAESVKKTNSAPINSAAATSLPVKNDAATERKKEQKQISGTCYLSHQ